MSPCLIGILTLALFAGQVQAEARVPGINLAQDAADFGVTGIEVRSVKSLDPAAINSEVTQAAGKGEKWPKEVIPVALKVVGEGLKGSSKTIEVRTPPESQDSAIVIVTESGYLDDAIAGQRWRLWLYKGPDGTWRVKRVLWAQLCNRPGKKFYSGEKCP